MRVLTPQSRCRFGVARADITPPIGIYHRMWGAAAHDRSEGIHRPLTATAMYFGNLERGGDAADYQILVAIDHCLLGFEEVECILQRAAQQASIAREAIAITFSHTHAAGLLNLDRAGLPGGEMIAPYLLQLEDTVARVCTAAVASASEVDIVYGTGRCDLAAHRDLWDADIAEFVCGYNPAAAADDTVTVARFTDPDGALRATMVNYACHPTTLAWDNRLISPDFPGAMRETVERETGVPCVFLQGASGELGPVEGFVGDTEVADRNGRQLAFAALSTLESLPPANTNFEYAGKVVSGASIGTWKRTAIDAARAAQISTWQSCRDDISLPYRDDLPSYDQVEQEHASLLAREQAARNADEMETAAEFRALAERKARMMGRLKGMPVGPLFPYQAVTWKSGDAIWLALQGEPYSMLQRELRTRLPNTPIIVASLANGWGPSYMPTRELYGQGIYQESIAALAPGSLETLTDVLAQRLANLVR